MFDTCYTNNESCFSFDNAACETIRTNKGRRSLVSRDRRACKGGDDSYAKNFVASCDDVPARAEYLTRRYFNRCAERAVCTLRAEAAWNLTARVALREAARNCMSKLAAAVNPPVVWLPVRADDVAVKDSAAYTQCETGSLSPRMEDREGWWHTACVYMTAYGPEKQERRECSAVKSAWYVAKRAAVKPVWYVGKPAAVEPPVPVMFHCAPGWYAVCSDDVVMIDAPAHTQCETGALPPHPEDRRCECAAGEAAAVEPAAQSNGERIPAPAITTEELAEMPRAELAELVTLCRTRLDALHKAPVLWTGAQAWSELLTYAQSELRYRAA